MKYHSLGVFGYLKIDFKLYQKQIADDLILWPKIRESLTSGLKRTLEFFHRIPTSMNVVTEVQPCWALKFTKYK
jgi:hypothetical protein